MVPGRLTLEMGLRGLPIGPCSFILPTQNRDFGHPGFWGWMWPRRVHGAGEASEFHPGSRHPNFDSLTTWAPGSDTQPFHPTDPRRST